jgi:hypothetical protein
MPGIVLTFPILHGKLEAWRRFCQEISGSRRPMHEASRRRLGITHERLALVETAFGAAAVTTIEAPNVGEALNQMATSDLTFDHWYREQVQELYGVSLARYEQFSPRTAPRQDPVLYFEWHEGD